MSLTLREIKLLKQRRKKSGPPSGVDFKRELTSSVLTSRGFHCFAQHCDVSVDSISKAIDTFTKKERKGGER